RSAGRAVLTVVAKGGVPSVAPTSRSVTSPAGTTSAQMVPHGPAIRVKGKIITLKDSQRLYWHELDGLEARTTDGVVAEVVRHPKDPNKLGLKNHSRKPWTVITNGNTRAVDIGQSVQLVGRSRIQCGTFEAELIA